MKSFPYVVAMHLLVPPVNLYAILQKTCTTLVVMHERLIPWFLRVRRPFPWRESPTPYRVWISEVMLQQTQASVVVSYFEKWMEAFPTIEALAQAPREKVLKLWEGLGYYSRARHIHEMAQSLVREEGGEIPSTFEKLLALKGLGRYTAGAILSFAHHQKAAAVDGNVTRVLARYFGIKKEVNLSSTKKEIEALAVSILPDEKPWLLVEGLIELGALVCKKKPQCNLCPLRPSCRAFAQEETGLLPIKGKGKPVTELIRSVAVIEAEDHFLLTQGEKGAIMADLWQFPFQEVSSPEDRGLWPEIPPPHYFFAPVKHSFTRFRALLLPFYVQIPRRIPLEFGIWVPKSEVGALPFSAGHKRILAQIPI